MASSLICRRVISSIMSKSGKRYSSSLSSQRLIPRMPIYFPDPQYPPPPPGSGPSDSGPGSGSGPSDSGTGSGSGPSNSGPGSGSGSGSSKSIPKRIFNAVFFTLTGASAAYGFATYAYTEDEAIEKARKLRESANQIVRNEASFVEKSKNLVSNSAKKVSAKTIELYVDLRRELEAQVRTVAEPMSDMLLPELHPDEKHVFTLVLDLNETLLYSDWKRERGWRTFKRPGVDAFLDHMSKFYEIVVYTDESPMAVVPIIERLDKKRVIRYTLSRCHTKYVDGVHYRDLSKLNRDPRKILYVSGYALENCLQRENCVPINRYRLETDDTTLVDLIPFLEYVARSSPSDIRTVLTSYEGKDIPKEFIERSKEYQRKMQEKRQQGGFWRR